MGQTHGEEASASGSQSTTKSSEALDTLHEDMAKEVAKHMSLKDIASLAQTSREHHRLFQPLLDEAKKAYPLLKAVVEANPEVLARLVIENPELLFNKGQVKDPAGQRFYDVSAYQLITFLGDARMKREIMALVSRRMTAAMEKKRQAQYEEIEWGGPDLVKMSKNPTKVPFDEVLHHTETYTDFGNPLSATFPLLENPDGLIYYKEPGEAGEVHFYYANRKTQTVKEVYPSIHSREEPDAFDNLIASLDAMEDNSSHRSSNEQHRLIAKTLCHSGTEDPINLHRMGIQYDDCHGERYCDSRFDFNRYYNTNRQCIRLYAEEKWGEGDRAWIELGKRQRELLWRLQFLCQANLPFYPTPNFNDISNRREFNIYNLATGRVELVFGRGGLLNDFGSGFSLYKGSARRPMLCSRPRARAGCGRDLVAVCRLVEGEKEAVAKLKPEKEAVAELKPKQDSEPSFAGPNR